MTVDRLLLKTMAAETPKALDNISRQSRMQTR
jgi:hypothetical protein